MAISRALPFIPNHNGLSGLMILGFACCSSLRAFQPSTLYLGGQEASAWIRRGGYSGARGDATRAARGSQVSKGRGLAEADTEP
jgi:hypothetical protein